MAQGGGKTYFLKFNMTKGQRYTFRAGMDMNMDQTIMGQEVHMNTRIGMYWQLAAIGDSAGWKKMEAMYDRMLMHINANGQGIDVDTDSVGTAEGQMASIQKALKAFTGQKFYYTVNDKGEVGSITGLKEIAAKVKANMGDMGGAEAMLGAFNEESFKQNLEQSYKYYPKKPVAIGESWDASMTINSGGVPMTTDGTYTLQAVNGDIATIKVVGKLHTAEGATVQGMAMTMTGTLDGLSQFELSSGQPVNVTADMNADMKMDFQGQEVPIKMLMKMNTVGKKI